MSTQGWTKTKETGIYNHEEADKMKVRATATNPTTGKRVQREKVLPSATMKQAKARRQEMIAAIKASEPEDGPQRTTIEALAKSFLEKKTRRNKKGWNETTLRINKRTLANQVLPPIGHVPVEDLDRELIGKWIDWAEGQRKDDEPTEDDPHADRYSQSTYDDWWKLLKYLVKEAYLQGFVERRFLHWVRDIPGPTSPVEGRRERETLSVDELESFVDAAESTVPRRYPEIATLAYTGMRRGALYGLEWKDLDFEDELMRLRRSFSDGELLDQPKTGEREVPMVPRVQDALHEQRERLKADENLGYLADDIVFPSNNGNRRYGSTILDPCKQAANAADIDQHVTPQVLRRTVNSRLLETNVDRLVLWSIVGHSSDEMTDHYAEIRMAKKREAIDALTEEGHA